MVLLVAVLVVGLVAVAVAVEHSHRGSEQLLSEMRMQVAVAVVWMSPLVAGAGVTLGWMRLRSRGEDRALALAGVGPVHLRLPVLLLGLLVGLASFLVAELFVPEVAPTELPAWVWLEDGPMRTVDHMQVQIGKDGIAGIIQRTDVDSSTFSRVRPYMAPWSALSADGAPAVATEWFARLARCVACGGFGLLGLAVARRSNPLVQILFVGGILLVLEAIGWTMAASGQLKPWIGGGVSAWLWVLPFAIAWRQPET
jgi:lipopolysaccharide export LptBFGC system permease protein LptF